MGSDSSVTSERKETLKVDSQGLPLIPQPTTSPLDPLNYPKWLKYTILVEISLLGFFAGLSGAMLSVAIAELEKEFNITPQVATYQTAVTLVSSACGALVLIPIANLYGHRLVFLLCTTINFIALTTAAFSTSYAMLLGLRAFTGFGWTAMVLGVGVLPNLFFVHQRGRAVGMFTVIALNGSHASDIIGGFVAHYLGWRWTLWMSAIPTGTMIVVTSVLLPDTLFQRPNQNLTLAAQFETDPDSAGVIREHHRPPPMTLSTYLCCLKLVNKTRMPDRHIRLSDVFIRPFEMLKYPSVSAPVFYYAITSSLAAIGPIIVLPGQFTEIYHFNSIQNGLAVGLSLLIGTALGEVFSGPATDFLIERARKKATKGGKPAQPEIRLQGIWSGAIIVPLGLLTYGFTLRYANTFVAPCIAVAITCLGVQVITSVCFTYTCSDCYPSRSTHLSQCFNFFQNIFSIALSFYEIPFGKKIGYEWSFVVYAILCTLFFLPVAALMIRGPRWRENLGPPKSY